MGDAVLRSDAYTFDSNTRILTINNILPVTRIVTVTSIGDDGCVYVAVYHASYSCGEGYTAYLMYSNVDIAKTAALLGRNFNKIGSAAASSISGLFKK